MEDNKKLVRVHPAITAIKALLQGIPVRIDDYTYEVIDEQLGIWMTKTDHDGHTEQVFMNMDMDLSHFIQLTGKFSTEQQVQVVASIVLRNKRKY